MPFQNGPNHHQWFYGGHKGNLLMEGQYIPGHYHGGTKYRHTARPFKYRFTWVWRSEWEPQAIHKFNDHVSCLKEQWLQGIRIRNIMKHPSDSSSWLDGWSNLKVTNVSWLSTDPTHWTQLIEHPTDPTNSSQWEFSFSEATPPCCHRGSTRSQLLELFISWRWAKSSWEWMILMVNRC